MNRLVEIDFIKGCAVITMVIFHVFYLSKFMDIYPFQTQKGMLFLFARFAQLVFITTLGINLVISYQKNQDDEKLFHKKQTKRVLNMILVATFATTLSYFAFPDNWVKFGIIHFALVSIFLLQWVAKDEKLIATILFGVLTIEWIKPLLIPFFQTFFHPFISFILGIYNFRYNSIDHFALIPNIAIICGGMLLGWTFYNKAKRKFKSMDDIIKTIENKLGKNNKFVKFITFLGKYSLWVYVIHYPIVYFLLLAIKKMVFQPKYNLIEIV